MRALFLIMCLFIPVCIFSQSALIRVLLKDSAIDEAIENYCVELNGKKAYTNGDGICVFRSSIGIMKFRFIDHDSSFVTKKYTVLKDTFIIFYLSRRVKEFRAASVKSSKDFFFVKPGRISISNQILKDISLPLSTNDPIHLIKLMPGVTTSQEMNSALSFRGANSYNTCIYLDDIPTPNLSHSFGLFSFFDIKNIRAIDYYNSQVSSENGLRGSSYLRFFLNDPLLNSSNSEFSISPFLISGNINTKLIKNKLGVYVNYRNSILSQAINELIPLFSNFNDLTFKLKYKINEKSTLNFTGLRSRDRLNSEFGFGLDINDSSKWDFDAASIQYRYVNKSIESTSSAYVRSQALSNYQNGEEAENSYKLVEFNLKQVLKFNLMKQVLNNLGAEVCINNLTRHKDSLSNQYTNRMNVLSLFIDNIYSKGKFSGFVNLRINKFLNDTKIVPETRMGLSLRQGQIIARVEYNEFVNSRHSLSKNLLPTTFDFVILSEPKFRPNKIREMVIGSSISKVFFDVELSAFKRNYLNTFDYKSLSVNDLNHVSNIVSVNQSSYGTELLLNLKVNKKNHVTLTYTYLRSLLQNDSVNYGVVYPANYDRPHNLNVLYSKSIHKWQFTSSFNLQSGRPITIPLFVAYQNVPIFSGRNEYRLPLYHRLDLGVKYTVKKNGNPKHIFQFYVYNAYWRKNIYGIIWTSKPDTNEYKLYQLSAFPFLPSFNYSFCLN